MSLRVTPLFKGALPKNTCSLLGAIGGFMLGLRRAVLALLLCVFATQVIAAPSPRDPDAPGARVLQFIKMVKRVLIRVAHDEPQPPPPHP